jgi:hypothetical protein
MKPRFRTIPLTLFVALLASAAVAQTPASPAPPGHPAIEPAAMEILKATGDKLASAGAMSFTAIATFQYPARNGQPLCYTNEYDVVMRRPDKLRVIMPGDGNASEYYYDGKVMVVYSPAFDLVAFADAPPTIDAMLKVAEEKAAPAPHGARFLLEGSDAPEPRCGFLELEAERPGGPCGVQHPARCDIATHGILAAGCGASQYEQEVR